MNEKTNNIGTDYASEEIINYGKSMMRMLLIAYAVAVITASVMGLLFEGMLFLLVFVPLRQNAGGYHTKNRLTCGIISIIIYIGVLNFIKYLYIYKLLQVVLCIAFSVIVMFLAPIDTTNNPLDEVEIEVYRKRTRLVVLIEFICFGILNVLGLCYWSKIFVISACVECILLLVGKVNKFLGSEHV